MKAVLYPLKPRGRQDVACGKNSKEMSNGSGVKKDERRGKLPMSHSAPTLVPKNNFTKEDPGIYGPVGSREASVKWFKTTQARDLVSQPDTQSANNLYAEWFHGIITRRDSERLLEHREVGCFLIRLGESRLGYTLSFRDVTRCRHYMLDYIENEHFYHVLGEPIKHRSLADLVQYYQQNCLQNWSRLLTTPCPQEEGQCDYLELIITPEEEKTLDGLWSLPRLEASAPEYEAKTAVVGGQYGIALTQHSTSNPRAVQAALNQVLSRHEVKFDSQEERYSAEPVRASPKPAPQPRAAVVAHQTVDAVEANHRQVTEVANTSMNGVLSNEEIDTVQKVNPTGQKKGSNEKQQQKITENAHENCLEVRDLDFLDNTLMSSNRADATKANEENEEIQRYKDNHNTQNNITANTASSFEPNYSIPSDIAEEECELCYAVEGNEKNDTKNGHSGILNVITDSHNVSNNNQNNTNGEINTINNTRGFKNNDNTHNNNHNNKNNSNSNSKENNNAAKDKESTVCTTINPRDRPLPAIPSQENSVPPLPARNRKQLVAN